MLSPSKKLPRSPAAFTLLEVALAATVLLFAIVSAFQLVVVGTRMLDFSRKQTIAAQIIHAEIDQAHVNSWTTVKNIADNYATVTVQLNALASSNTWAAGSVGYPELLSLQNVAQVFSVKRVVSYVGTRTDMVSIVFTVTWTTKNWTGGVTRTYSRQGTTYVGKNGLSATYQRS